MKATSAQIDARSAELAQEFQRHYEEFIAANPDKNAVNCSVN